MIIDIQTVPSGRSVVSQDTDLGPFMEDLPPLAGKISCRAEMERSGEVLYVHLHFHGTCELECSRCLQRFAFPLKGDLRVTIKERPGKHGPAHDDGEADFFYDSRHLEVDLRPSVYEEIMTALPLKPLCSEACSGIEFQDEKKDNASGTEEDIDPRWEALKKLKKGS